MMIQEAGYNSRSFNCTQYPLALLGQVLTPTGYQKLNSVPAEQPWVFYAVSHLKGLANAANGAVTVEDCSAKFTSGLASHLTSDTLEFETPSLVSVLSGGSSMSSGVGVTRAC